jgi:hypothetical protein
MRSVARASPGRDRWTRSSGSVHCHAGWLNQGTDGSIGRANLTGPVDVHENFVPRGGGAVGRANLDGSGAISWRTAAFTRTHKRAVGCGQL